jgi:hypothetical protein
MSGSAVLDTALGVIFVFLAVSLMSSGVVEWVSNKLDKRGEYLLRGLREMLDLRPGMSADEVPPPTGLLERKRELPKALEDLGAAGSTLFQPQQRPGEPADLPTARPAVAPAVALGTAEHPYLADLLLARPVVASLHRPERPAEPGKGGWSGRGGAWKRDLHLTSYLSAETFARALFDLLVPDTPGQPTPADLEDRLRRLPANLPARESLLVMLREAGDDVARFRRSVEHWYDEQMGRVSGWYKRWSQWRLFIVGALIAVCANVSAIAVASAFYAHEPVRAAVVAQSQAAQLCPDPADLSCAQRRLDVLEDLSIPVGWDLGRAAADCRAGNGGGCGGDAGAWVSWAGDSLGGTGADGVLLRLLGWLLTAAAVSFGAPFWFDALGKLGSLRTAGRPPRPVAGS